MTCLLKIKMTILVLMALFFVCETGAQADIYRFVDADGVVHFTNTPTQPKYSFYRKEKVVQGLGNNSWDDIISHHANQFSIDEALIRAVIKVESDFDPTALSSKGAQGMMQLIPETCRDMQVNDPFDPSENIRGGSRYLRMMLDRFNGNLDLALAAYNAGPSTVSRFGGIPPYKETREYVQKVKQFLEKYRVGDDTTL